MEDWAVAIIAIICILAVAYTIALIWALFIRKKQPVPTWEHSGEGGAGGAGGILINNNNNNNNNNQMGMMGMMGAAPAHA